MHALLLLGCGVLYYLLASRFVPLPSPHLEVLLRLIRGSVMVIILLAVAKAVSVYVSATIPGSRPLCGYLVPPRDAGSIKTRLIKKLLAALNEEPEKVMFPKGDAR